MWARNWFNSFLHPEEAYNQAGKEAEQGWQQAQGFERPYWQAGLDQMGRLTGAEDALLNPEALQAKWSQGYEMSPSAKQEVANAKSAGLDAASSSGLLGSSASIGNIQSGAANIMNRDRQQYMDDLMKKYMTGIGLGQSMYGTGASMGQTLGQQGIGAAENRAGATYGANAAPGEQFKSMMNMALKAWLGKNYNENTQH